MDNKDIQWIKELLYDEDETKLKDAVSGIEDPLLLHAIAYNYNWDDGFEIPALITENRNCDLGTALMVFYDADGYGFFTLDDKEEKTTSKEWLDFVMFLYKKITQSEFRNKGIQYKPELTKVQQYKLKKANSYIPDVFIYGTQGTNFVFSAL